MSLARARPFRLGSWGSVWSSTKTLASRDSVLLQVGLRYQISVLWCTIVTLKKDVSADVGPVTLFLPLLDMLNGEGCEIDVAERVLHVRFCLQIPIRTLSFLRFGKTARAQ